MNKQYIWMVALLRLKDSPSWLPFLRGVVPPGCVLSGGTVPPGCVLSGGTVPLFNLSQDINQKKRDMLCRKPFRCQWLFKIKMFQYYIFHNIYDIQILKSVDYERCSYRFKMQPNISNKSRKSHNINEQRNYTMLSAGVILSFGHNLLVMEPLLLEILRKFVYIYSGGYDF